MASPERGIITQERVGRGVKYSGVVIAILGAIALNLPAALLGGAGYVGGKWVENTGKRQQQTS